MFLRLRFKQQRIIGQKDRWLKYIDGLKSGSSEEADRAATELIDSMLAEGFDATTDYPACLIYDRLLERFPNAKVVLTVRGSPEKWADSVLNTIGRLSTVTRFPINYIVGSDMVKLGLWLWEATPKAEFLQNQSLSRASLIDAHEEWKRQVIKTVPKDKLLVFEAKDGWEPLCSFLGLPIPDTPYPRVNSGEEMGKSFDRMEMVADYWGVLLLVVLAVLCLAIKQGTASTTKKKQQ